MLMRNGDTSGQVLRVHVDYESGGGPWPGEWTAYLYLDYVDTGEDMGRIETWPSATLCGAIENMNRFVLSFGYRGRLEFEGRQGEDYGTTDFSGDVPRYRKPWQMDTTQLVRERS